MADVSTLPDEQLSENQFKKKNFKFNLWTFSAGGIGRDFAYGMWTSSLLTFALLTRGLNETQFALLSVIISVCRVWDAVNDPVMGLIIERTRTKWGKFKPWIMLGAVTNSIIIVVLFWTELQGMAFVWFFLAMYLLWDISYTMNDIGYWSMLPSLTSDEKDRNTLSSIANVLAGLGGGGAYVLVPILTVGALAINNNALDGFRWSAIIVMVVFIGCQTMTSILVREYPRSPAFDKDKKKTTVKKMFNTIFKNDQLLVIAGCMLLYNTGANIVTGMGAMYIYFKYDYNGTMSAVFVTLSGIIAGVAMLAYPYIAKKFSRKQIHGACIAAIVAGYALMFVSTMVFKNILGFAALCLFYSVVCFGQSLFYMLLTIGISNCIEYNEWKTGEREEGIIFSVRPLMAKIGSSLQMIIIMVLYLVANVTDFTNKISNIENEANRLGDQFVGNKTDMINELLSSVENWQLLVLAIGMTILPIMFHLSAYILYKAKFKIDETKYNDMFKDIEARKALSADASAEANEG